MLGNRKVQKSERKLRLAVRGPSVEGALEMLLVATHGEGKPTFSLFMDNKTEWWKDFPVNPEKKTLQIEKHVQFSYVKFVRREFDSPMLH